MTAATLLEEMRKLGVELSLADDDLVYRAEKGTMTPALIEHLRKQKPALVRELKSAKTEDSKFDQLAKTLLNDVDYDKPLTHGYARHVEPLKSRLLERVGLDINFVAGENCFLTDESGNRYLDCISQYGGLPFGYNPVPIWEAIESLRTQQIPNVATQSLLNSAGELAKQLLQLLPVNFEHVVFCNSGAEATEVAIKMSRSATGRAGILSTKNGFHGLTTGALSTTGSHSFQDGFFVAHENFQHVDFGDARQLSNAIAKRPNHFAAFVVEPVQGEAGIVFPPPGYLKQVREICSQNGVLMVVDEVQTGLGRTGEMFAFQSEDVIPDVITLAKALGGGLVPCGAVIAQPNAYSLRFGLRHSSTFAGNAMAMKCGLKTLELLRRDNRELLHRVQSNGSYLLNGLRDIAKRFPSLIREVRGRGYMAAIEFDFESLADESGLLPILVDEDLLMHLMISFMLHHHKIRLAPTFMGRDVIRIEPPLVFERQHCDQILNAMKDTIKLVANGNTAALVAPMIQLPAERLPEIAAQVVVKPIPSHQHVATLNQRVGEFGFLVHLSNLSDLVRFDNSLATFSQTELADLKYQLTRSSDSLQVGTTDFPSATGACVRGHFGLVPFTPAELTAMPHDLAIKHINQAAQMIAGFGVNVIGLGGFTSVLTQGGLAIDSKALPPITSGNSFTVAATIAAVESACIARGTVLSNATVAVVGAAGQIGRASALILSSRAKKLILVGRDGTSERTRCNLEQVNDEIVQQRINGYRGEIIVAKDVSQIIQADIVVVASSAVEPFIKSDHIKPSAIVCDASRPANVSQNVIDSRSDVDWIEGGLVDINGCTTVDLFAGPRADAAYACVAETALWTLCPELGSPRATRLLNIDEIDSLWDASQKHGFKVVR